LIALYNRFYFSDVNLISAKSNHIARINAKDPHNNLLLTYSLLVDTSNLKQLNRMNATY